jgi:hypothetical protein
VSSYAYAIRVSAGKRVIRGERMWCVSWGEESYKFSCEVDKEKRVDRVPWKYS